MTEDEAFVMWMKAFHPDLLKRWAEARIEWKMSETYKHFHPE